MSHAYVLTAAAVADVRSIIRYAKAQATDLMPDEKKAVAGFAAIIKTAAGIAEGDA